MNNAQNKWVKNWLPAAILRAKQNEIHSQMDAAMDEILVQTAANLMREKLTVARNRGRGGWWNPKACTVQGLRELMTEHVDKGDPVDVMNLAAMVAVRELLETPVCGGQIVGCTGGPRCTSDHK